MRRVSIIPSAAGLAAAADRRLGAALARQAAADRISFGGVDDRVADLMLMPVDRAPAPEPVPGFTRALAAWLGSWALDGLSRIELALARSIARDRRRAAAKQRPAARARDGPT